MRRSKLFSRTTRETPSDADILSHKLMLKSGMIHQVASGDYTYMRTGGGTPPRTGQRGVYGTFENSVAYIINDHKTMFFLSTKIIIVINLY